MYYFKHIFFLLFLTIPFSITNAQIREFTHPEIISFEHSTDPITAGKNSKVSLSNKHYKHLRHSLQWNWDKPNAQIFINQPIGYLSQNPNSKETSLSTFIFWIYNPKAISSGKLKFEFLKQGKVCSWFEYGMNFTGWSGAWLIFSRDMQGTPEEGMDELRITAPNTDCGEIFLDHIILSSFQDVRHQTADFQAPYINPETTSHWLVLLKSWGNDFDLPISARVSSSEQKNINDVETRLKQLLLPKKQPDVSKLKKQFIAYNITENPDGSISGLPIFFERFGEAYANLGGENYAKIYANPMGLRNCVNFMYNLAIAWNNSTNNNEKTELANMFILMTRHMLDQGFRAGSAMGTLHHLGYSMRNYYPAMFLMKDVLVKAELDQDIQQAMEWFAGTGEVKLKPEIDGMDIDAFNTSLIGRLSSIMMMKDSPQKVTYLHSISRWIDNGLHFSDGTMDCFKIDGSIFHHRHDYPAYAVGGLDGAVNSVWLLQDSEFEISRQSHENLKFALLTMRKYCNLVTWPLSLSGRHPDGKGKLIPWHYARLAEVGSPDKTEKIDTELASAYLRLNNGKKDSYSKKFTKAGIMPEKAPEGNWGINYSCLAVHRRGNWLATAMGHSRYLWATESYIGANYFGRYLNHGNLQILGSGNPIDMFASGFNQQGWDWNHIPGTTAAVIPMKDLKADIRQVDDVSGYEEMLLSDESFAGAISSKNRNGAFGMKLHEHDKYNGSLRAHKSYFFFDNRIIALGSDIESALPDAPVHTTLFQVYLPEKESPIFVNGKKISDFPYEKRLSEKTAMLGDGKKNYYLIRNGNITVHKSLQHSLDEETCAPTENNFALAAIDHGKTPHNASYEYMVLIQPSEKEKKQYQKSGGYIVLQQNKRAHIVRDKVTSTTGYVLFEEGEVTVGNEILSVNHPCLIMTAKENKDKMTISVCDPDLHFYEGPADEQYDKNGKRIERSVYSRKWIDNPSAKSTIKIKINGTWNLETPSDYIKISGKDTKSTFLEVSCQHGMTREVNLIKD